VRSKGELNSGGREKSEQFNRECSPTEGHLKRTERSNKNGGVEKGKSSIKAFLGGERKKDGERG